MSRVYSLKISLPYHILLLLLIAESPEVHNSNLIGCKFLFAWKLSLQVWWICCSIYGNWLERFTVPIWFTLPVHCCRTGLSLTSVFFCSSLHLCWYVSNHFPIFRLVFFAGPFVLYLRFGFALLVWPLFFCMCLARLVCPLCPLIAWLEEYGILFGTVTLLLFTLVV